MTLIDRLERGERWDGDNAEVLRALQNADKDPIWWTRRNPLDSVDAALALVPPDKTVNLRIEANGSAACALDNEDCYSDGDLILPTAAIALTVAILKASQP